MPARTPTPAAVSAEALAALGEQIRAHRKALRVSAVAAAQAASISRVTLHRIERGEPSVTIGAYANAAQALGLQLAVAEPTPVESYAVARDHDTAGWIPARVRLADYPQLKQLAWQVQGIDELKPNEALDIYERNWRHVDQAALDPRERQLIDSLRLAFGDAASRGV